jgi:hypothetical protein
MTSAGAGSAELRVLAVEDQIWVVLALVVHTKRNELSIKNGIIISIHRDR